MPYGSFSHVIIAFALATVRITCALQHCPPFSNGVFTGIARRATVIVLSLPLVPPLLSRLQPFPDGTILLWMMLREAVIGCVFGFLASVPFRIGEMAGNAIDNQRGATMGEVFSPMSGALEAPTATFLVQFLVAVFYASGAVLLLLSALYRSYALFPLGADPLHFASDLPQRILGLGDTLMHRALMLAAPALLVMVLATVGLGIVNRSAPQLNVFFLSMPVKSALGLLVLLLALPFMMEVIFDGAFALLHRVLAVWLR